MNKKSTPGGRFISVILLLTLITVAVNAQTIPKLKFRQPHLVAGVDGQVGATYRFLNISPNINANIKIENIVGGAILRNIDDSTLAYYDAWQPTVGGPGTIGSSYIKWDITFDSAGAPYVYSILHASGIDIDGDGVKVREFVNVNGQASYSVPTQVPSALTISMQKDTDNIMGTDASDSNLHVLGPVSNRVGIDTLSQDVRVDFNFANASEFKIYTGSQVDDNGATGAIATDRYHCIYFMDISGTLSVLPVQFQSVNATFTNNKVNVYWVTTGESKNGHFEVERSFDQNTFATVATVSAGQYDKNTPGQYSFVDEDENIRDNNSIWYRIRNINPDSSVSYSAIKLVRTGATGVASPVTVTVLPNPYMDQINLNFKTALSGTAEIKMMNLSGQVVKRIQTNVAAGNNNLQLQGLGSQAPGIYVIYLAVNGNPMNGLKVVKQ